MSQQYKKTWSTSLANKEIQIKTILQFHLTPVRISSRIQTNVDEDVEKMEP
jgi:hypothetical protein